MKKGKSFFSPTWLAKQMEIRWFPALKSRPSPTDHLHMQNVFIEIKRGIMMWTHSVHQSASRCRPVRAPSRWVEPSETCSTCWPGSSVHHRHSVRHRHTVVIHPPQHRQAVQRLTSSCLKQLSKLSVVVGHVRIKISRVIQLGPSARAVSQRLLRR